jgi:hypothetical protein
MPALPVRWHDKADAKKAGNLVGVPAFLNKHLVVLT